MNETWPVGAPLPDWKPARVPSEGPMEGRYCRLERLNGERHAVALHAAFGADAGGWMWTYLPYGPFATAGAYRAWVDEMAARRDPLLFAICERATGRAVGVTGFLRIDPPNGCIEIGHLAYSPALQRTPAATEATYLLLEHAFACGNRRCEWKCDALNRPSRAAALRYGFSPEGLFRQAVVVKGRNRDTAWFSLLDREWPSVRAAFRTWLAPENFDAGGRQLRRLADLTAPLVSRMPPDPERPGGGLERA